MVEEKPEGLTGNLRFKDDESDVIFNHFSFCEFVKHIMMKYGKADSKLVHKKLTESNLMKSPKSIDDVAFLTHELEFHWAMLLVYGERSDKVIDIILNKVLYRTFSMIF